MIEREDRDETVHHRSPPRLGQSGRAKEGTREEGRERKKWKEEAGRGLEREVVRKERIRDTYERSLLVLSVLRKKSMMRLKVAKGRGTR